jgi:hypothetical protein
MTALATRLTLLPNAAAMSFGTSEKVVYFNFDIITLTSSYTVK